MATIAKPNATTEEVDLATRAVWLSYIGGYNQSQIAERLGVSRIKVHRLISLAHRWGLVRVNIEHSLSEHVALEEQLVKRFGLNVCLVVPTLGDGDLNMPWSSTARALGIVGARFLRRQLMTTSRLTLGVGWGRTLAAVADQMLYETYAQHRFVALIGSLTRHSSTNPYDVIHRLVDRTAAEGYYLPVPYIADSLADKAVFMSQRIVQDVLTLARRADVSLVGIGQCSENSFLKSAGLITDEEFAELRAAGAVGDLIGKFFDAEGRLVDCEVNERSMGLEFETLGECCAVAVAGGLEKVQAIDAALKSGVITGLITDEEVAQQLLKKSDKCIRKAARRKRRQTAV